MSLSSRTAVPPPFCPVTPDELDLAISDLEVRLERLRALYEQYFMGIERLEPTVVRKDVDRRFWVLRKEKIRNTAKRFKMQMLVQRYNTMQQYWGRICREIENGTYKRHKLRAERTFAAIDAQAAQGLEGFEGEPAEAQSDTERLEGEPARDTTSSRAARATRAAEDDLRDLLASDFDPAAELDAALDALFAPSPAKADKPAPAKAAPPAGQPKAEAAKAEPAKRGGLLAQLGAPPPAAPAPERPPAPSARPAPTGPGPGTAPQAPPRSGPPVPSGPPQPPPRPSVPSRSAPPLPPPRPASSAPPLPAPRSTPAGSLASKPPLPPPRSMPAPPPPRPAAPAAPPAAAPAAAAPKPAAAARPAVPTGPVQPAPAKPAAQPAPAKPAAASSALDDSRLKELHQRYQAAREQTKASPVSLEKLAQNLRETEAKLRAQHQGKRIDFDVVVKDGKAVIKPKLS